MKNSKLISVLLSLIMCFGIIGGTVSANAAVKTVNLTKADSYNATGAVSSKSAYIKGTNASSSKHYVMFQAQYKGSNGYENDVCKNIQPGKACATTHTYTFSSNVNWRLYLNPTLYYTSCSATGSVATNSSFK